IFDTHIDVYFGGNRSAELFAQQSASISLGDFQLNNRQLLMIRYMAYAAILAVLWLLLLQTQRGQLDPKWTRALGPVLLAIYLADVGFYFSQSTKLAPRCPPGTPVAEALSVQKSIYRPQRYSKANQPADADKLMEVVRSTDCTIGK